MVSELFYEGQLEAAPHNSNNQVDWDGQRQGLLFEPVPHAGNGTFSEAEVEHIAALVDQLLGRPYHLARGESGVLSGRDILITAPYNLQVNRLKQRLCGKARVGTVDKFQGQQAPVVFFTMTSSSADDMPRDADFLFSRNRLNVALSRAKCLAYVVCTDELLNSRARDLDDMRLISTLCAAVEYSEHGSISSSISHPTTTSEVTSS